MKKALPALMVALVLAVVASCAHHNPYSLYNEAVLQYDQVTTNYRYWYDAAPPDVQERWRADYSPKLIRASELLEFWGTALTLGEVETEDSMDYWRKVSALLDQVLMEIAREASREAAEGGGL